MPADGRWAVNIPGSDCVDNKLFNNLIYNGHPWRGSILIPGPTPSGFESDYNVVMERFSNDGGNSVMGLAAWQALGHDLNSVVSTPDALFVDSTADDYHLKANSPALDRGISLADVTLDLEGRPRGDPPDIGAYEQISDQGPDLIGKWHSLKLKGPNKKGRYKVRATCFVTNGGNSPAMGFEVRVYYSRDDTLAGKEGIQLIKTKRIKKLVPSKSKKLKLKHTFKDDDPRGAYLIIEVDAAETVAETDETNNTTAHPLN
jgi:hypothetical protein